MSDYEMDGSSDEEHFYEPSDDDDLEEIRREVEQSQTTRRAQASAAAARPTRQPPARPSPLDPLAGATGAPGGARSFGGGLFGPGASLASMMAGASGMGPGLQPSPEAFRASYVAYSTSIYEAQEGRGMHQGREHMMYGGYILMPPEALDQLTRMDIEGPWTFDLINPTDQDRRAFAGVLEFTAPPGTVYLPQWLMSHLGFSEGSNIRINGASLPKGKFVKLEPQELTFLELSDPKAVLEKALSHFPSLTLNSVIEISHQSIQLMFKILEIKPDHKTGIEIRNTDIEVDFAPPVGYVPPAPQPRAPPPTMASKLGINVDATHDDKSSKAAAGYDAFVGTGHSVGGKRIKGKGTKDRKIQALPEGARVQRTDRQRFINANNMPENDEAPAPLRLPFGHLFFGYPIVPVRPDQDADAAAGTSTQQQQQPTQSFTGQGATLSGRSSRPPPTTTTTSSSSRASSENTTGSDRWGSGGQTLGSKARPRPERKVIEIDDD